MRSFTEARIVHAEAIERTVDAVIETVLTDNHVECKTPEDGPPVSSETWLAVKASILALVGVVAQ